ncbi:membrane progestin receptor gamma isoform X3 [Podarcis raffonei]|uniref:membrane progestin receptor gamma isoform X3 n=1 Tax=Podarcis raffonei TaxID=65483 RepID=UPI00232972E8|nr:membrane progestin receptor gamma isoform X3 [Podarcis raffonei]
MNTILSLKLPRLLNTDQVPKVFREKGILFGYRHPRSSATDCIVSLFQMTNETVNIWTHFLPAWYFLWKLLALVYALDVWRDSYTWPFLAYMVTCCIYPLTSSIAHTFSTMSSRARHICYFFDYGALALYSLGSAIAYSAYVFPEEWIGSTFHHYYVSTAVLNTVVGTSLSCYSRLGLPYFHYKSGGIERFNEMEQPKFSKSIRTFAFAHPYVFDSIPLFYRGTVTSSSTSVGSLGPTSKWKPFWLTWPTAVSGYWLHPSLKPLGPLQLPSLSILSSLLLSQRHSIPCQNSAGKEASTRTNAC